MRKAKTLIRLDAQADLSLHWETWSLCWFLPCYGSIILVILPVVLHNMYNNNAITDVGLFFKYSTAASLRFSWVYLKSPLTLIWSTIAANRQFPSELTSRTTRPISLNVFFSCRIILPKVAKFIFSAPQPGTVNILKEAKHNKSHKKSSHSDQSSLGAL